jgi:hypothetical protein
MGGERIWLWTGRLAVPIALVGGAVAYFLTRPPGQPQVSADVLPVVAAAHRAAAYTDCSKVNSVACLSDNPCQTFVLLESNRFSSAEAFLAAETRSIIAAGWHHSAPQPVDYDGGAGGMAMPSESWVAPVHQACAYIATAGIGVAAEAAQIFPRDPYDVPEGVYEFYRTAKDANLAKALWVRLYPEYRGGC